MRFLDLTKRFKHLEQPSQHGAELCILCGRCNDDPGLALTKDERRAPRHHVWLCKRGEESAWLYSHLLNGIAERSCPRKVEIDKEIIEARRKMVENGAEMKENKEFFEKVREGKNPYL